MIVFIVAKPCAKNKKLEFIWIGKENRLKLEPRTLLEDGLDHYFHYTGAWFNSLEFEGIGNDNEQRG